MSKQVSHLGGQAEGAGRIGQQAARGHLFAGCRRHVPRGTLGRHKVGLPHPDFTEIVACVVNFQIVPIVQHHRGPCTREIAVITRTLTRLCRLQVGSNVGHSAPESIHEPAWSRLRNKLKQCVLQRQDH